MSKFVRKTSNQATRYALIAFKDILSTKVCSVDDVTGPKIKCVGATVKVICNGLIQKGTIVTISDNRESLVKQCEYFNVRKYFGLSTRTKSVQGTNFVKKETKLSQRSYSVAGPITWRSVKKVNSTPISTRRSVCYNRPLPSPIVNPKNPFEFPDIPSPNRHKNRSKSSSKPTTTGSSTRLRQRLITDYFSVITRTSSSDKTLNIEDAMDELDETNLSDVFEEDHDNKSLILVNNLDNLFDMIPESLVAKNLREEFDDTSNSTASSYITHNQGICFARDVILNNATRNANVMKYLDLQQSATKRTTDSQDPETSIASTARTTTTIPTDAPKLTVSETSTFRTSVNTIGKPSTHTFPPSRLPGSTGDIYEELTPMELFRSLMWKCDYSKLHTNLITEDVLQYIKLRSKTPEIFARNLMYRLFTIQELKGCNVYGKGYINGIRNGHLNPDIVKIIYRLTYRMFPFVKFSWQNCVRWMNKSIRYVTSLIPEKTTVSDPVHLPDVTPLLSSTIIQYSDTSMPHSTVDVSLIERDSSALTDILDSSLPTYLTVPISSTIRKDSSVCIPLLITTKPESWEDSLLQLGAIQPTQESWENSLQPTVQLPESWEHSLLQLTTQLPWKNPFRTIKLTLESWDNSLLHLNESCEESLLKTIQPTTESWEDSLLHLSIKNMTPESQKQPLLKTIQPTTESWDYLLCHSIKNITRESSEQSLLNQRQNHGKILCFIAPARL
ncbi:hypothetical protein LOTGIDRAFT_154062 [Lottia gigantea]|uniref:BEN domain-containing protein n=1 Tax=Lottia gigantea TaxID=225164 RepID=V3ZX93_LOTGI|nr:hypothetical protein LOTGIDRAFT_154062 [Lottia gigantea]ESO88992.1 hypothetical protein LOTGIDRAFT_154062 [Lottia gigantea]